MTVVADAADEPSRDPPAGTTSALGAGSAPRARAAFSSRGARYVRCTVRLESGFSTWPWLSGGGDCCEHSTRCHRSASAVPRASCAGPAVRRHRPHRSRAREQHSGTACGAGSTRVALSRLSPDQPRCLPELLLVHRLRSSTRSNLTGAVSPRPGHSSCGDPPVDKRRERPRWRSTLGISVGHSPQGAPATGGTSERSERGTRRLCRLTRPDAKRGAGRSPGAQHRVIRFPYAPSLPLPPPRRFRPGASAEA